MGTDAAISMLTTTSYDRHRATPLASPASRNTGAAVDLSSTVDSVTTDAGIRMLTTTTATDAAGVTGASRYRGRRSPQQHRRQCGY